ncbi:unnamed protein product [Leptidea sinapis]|uniref:Uncharacterized protein n=1 Tax=Leptidea sinapis TaxID=189913 RepID=A0A5E4QZM2_9NEOP|nr:unnamed protein product [Leptidea sinapis]
MPTTRLSRVSKFLIGRCIENKCDIIPSTWMCGGTFFRVLQSCGISLLVRCFHDLTIWVESPVIPLVLQENEGGDDHPARPRRRGTRLAARRGPHRHQPAAPPRHPNINTIFVLQKRVIRAIYNLVRQPPQLRAHHAGPAAAAGRLVDEDCTRILQPRNTRSLLDAHGGVLQDVEVWRAALEKHSLDTSPGLTPDVASLCVFYRIYRGECPEELYDIIPTIWTCGGPPQCGFQGAFFLVLRSCGMSFLVRCFRDHTTWVLSRKARTPSLKAGNVLVIPLVLQERLGGGDHLIPGDPYARLSTYSIKKKPKRGAP